MNNCHLMHTYKKMNNEIKQRYQPSDHDEYYFYECFIDENNHFIYQEIDFSKNMRYELAQIIKIRKSIPRILHKMVLYYYFIPKY